MARPKTRGELKPLNLNIDAVVSDTLSKTANQTGLTKTIIVEKALKEYLEKYKVTFDELAKSN